MVRRVELRELSEELRKLAQQGVMPITGAPGVVGGGGGGGSLKGFLVC